MTARIRGGTKYSEEIPGAFGNYDWPVTFDKTNGYVGITQKTAGNLRAPERILLSPAQVRALVAFVQPATARKAPLRNAKPRKAATSRRPRPITGERRA